MDDPYTSGLIAIAAAVSTILFSALREALVLYNPSRLKESLGSSPKSQRVDRYVSLHDELEFATLAMLGASNVVLVLALATLLGAFAPAADGGGSTLARLAPLLLILPAVYVANQFIPGPIVRWKSDAMVLRGMAFVDPIRWMLTPVFRVQSSLTKAVARMIGRDPAATEERELVDEIESVTDEGERGGVIEEEGARMIKGILRMQDHQVDEVMIPRIDIKSVSLETSIDEAVESALVHGHSRIPVHQETVDQIVGILYVKDLLQYWRRDVNGKTLAIQDLMRKPTFVPEDKRILDLLRDFRVAKNHMAIVLDEYGGTAGLITIEDILEEIVGEIEDEYDLPTEESFRLLDDGSADIDAKVHIDEVNETLHIELEDDGDFDTIGGFVFSTLGKIPDPGESFVHGNVRFTVTDAGERRINRVRLTVLRDEPEG